MSADIRHLPDADGVDFEDLAREGALSIDDTAAFLDCSRSRVYELISAAELRTVRHGRHRSVLKASAIAFLAQLARGEDERRRAELEE